MIVWRFTIWRMQDVTGVIIYKAEWKIYASKISGMFEGGIG